MLSTKILGSGTIILVSGVVAIGAFLFGFVTNPQIYTSGLFLAGGGFILMVFGLFSLVGSGPAVKKGLHADDASAFSVGLFRCMLAISIADNQLDDSEIKEILRIYKLLTKTSMSEQVIRDTAAEMMEHGASIDQEIKTIAGTLNNELKEKLIIASLYILAADGDMDEGELIMLDDIRLGLGLSLKHVEKMKKNFLEKRNLT